MGRYFCDYCDAFLTHDSEAGRQQHNRGWRHRENFRAHYKKFYPGFAAINAQHKHQQLHQPQSQPLQQYVPGPAQPPQPIYSNVLPPNAG